MLILALSFIPLNAQEKMEDDYNLSSDLFQLAQLYEINPKAAFKRIQNEQFYPINEKNQKLILLIQEGYQTKTTLNTLYLNQINIDYYNVYRNAASVEIGLDELLSIGRLLKDPFLIRSNAEIILSNEAPSKTNAGPFHDAGINGNGIKIGIIDIGFAGLTDAANSGQAPSSYAIRNYSPNNFESGITHGTACTEIVYDFVPNASYYLYKIQTPADLGLVMSQAIIDGVQIISLSMAFANQGWNDGTGLPNLAVKDATDAGIIVVTSVGNFGESHYKSSWNDPDGDDIFNYPSGADFNYFSVSPGGIAQISLQWVGTPSTSNDYDFYIYPTGTSNVVASSTSNNAYESTIVENTSSSTKQYRIKIEKKGSSSTTFQFFMAGTSGALSFFNDGGIMCPANSLEDLLFSVGTVNIDDYDHAVAFTRTYSSKGPTNNGNIAPDLSAPDGCTTLSYPGVNGFTGTSAAAPAAAGLMALFWSEHLYLNATDLTHLISKFANLYKDWGIPGKDNEFGFGGIYLPPYYAQSKFIFKAASNPNPGLDGPIKTMEEADLLSFPDVNLFFLGETFNDVNTTSLIMDKPNVYRSVGEDSVIK